MREIKFRAWDKAINQMTCAFELKDLGASDIGELKGIDGYEDCTQIIKDAPLMQFTGLKDKHGKEIYEGDILRMHVKLLRGLVVITVEIHFDNGAFWFTGDGHTDCNWHFYNAEDREVLGNKFEHPELLA